MIGLKGQEVFGSKFVPNTRPRNTSHKPRPRNHEPFDGDEDILEESLNSHLMDQKRHRGMEKPSQQNLKNTNFPKMTTDPRKGVLKRNLSRNHDVVHPKNHKGPINLRLQDEDEEDYEEHEDYDEEEHEVDSVREENIGSTSHGMSNTRKESRALNEAKKRSSKKTRLVFEVDECAGRVVGEDSQQLITKAGCIVREHAKFDGTTWKNHSDLLKYDIISKCTENSTYDPNCRSMARAMHSQLANQHKNRQYRLHLHFQKFNTTEEAIQNRPSGIKAKEWVKLCQKFASEEFQKVSTRNKKNKSFNEVPPAVGTVSIARTVHMKRQEGEEVSVIENYKIGHFSKKKNKMVNEKADEIWNELLNEETSSSYTPAEICMNKLHRIPGYMRGRSISTRQALATENLRMELELEKEKSKALEEKLRVIQEEQSQFKEEQVKHQEMQKTQMEYVMSQLARLNGTRSPEL